MALALSGAQRATLPAGRQHALAKLLATNRGHQAKVMNSLEANGFEPAERALVQRRFALAALADQSRSFFDALDSLRPSDANPLDASLAYLAPLTSAQWRWIVACVGSPDGSQVPAGPSRGEAYAALLEQRVEAAHRTQVLAARLEQGDVRVPGADHSDLIAFFKANPGFEFGKHFVATYLRKGADSRLQPSADPRALRHSLMKLERTLKLTDNHRQQDALLVRGFDSAQGIVRQGQRDFVRQIGAHPAVGEAQAAAIFGRAEQVAATTMHLAMKHRATGYEPAVMARRAPQIASRGDEALSDTALPNLESIFGTLDGTLGDPCLSVLSPPAYLVDLLQFLGMRHLPSVEIASPTDGEVIWINVDEEFATVRVEIFADSGGVANTYIHVTTALDQAWRATIGHFSESVRVPLGEQLILVQLMPSMDSKAAPLAEYKRKVTGKVQSLNGSLSDIKPIAVKIDADDTEYALGVVGKFSVIGAAHYEIRVTSNREVSTQAQISGDEFRAAIWNSASHDQSTEPQYRVELYTHVARYRNGHLPSS